MKTNYIETNENWQDYDLLDSGKGKVLERFGKMILVRPYPQAFWQKSAPELWKQANARFIIESNGFGGKWLLEEKAQKTWTLRWQNLKFQAQLASSQHIGIFPEAINHWLWLDKALKTTHQPIKLLNLWAYTGLINLVSSQSNVEITHVDSSKHAIGWAMANQKLSGLKDKPIRYIREEALKFIKREARREQCYNALILHLPRLENEEESGYTQFLKNLPELLDAIKDILEPNPHCLLVTAPSSIHPGTTQAIAENLIGTRDQTQSGEIHLKEKSTGRLLPSASFSRFLNK